LSKYPLFVLLSAFTIASPGPGVVLTMSTALSLDMRGTVGAILGLAVGSLIVATISAGGLGALLVSSPPLFAAIRIVGIAYLLYLGIRLWRTDPAGVAVAAIRPERFRQQFVRGIGLQLVNPNALLFFVMVFAQFIFLQRGYLVQFVQMAVSYGILVVLIHISYALLARNLNRWRRFTVHGRVVNKLAGGALVAFGAALAVT
jgi:threonine/homoserine/homoserine lactone efflux protein